MDAPRNTEHFARRREVVACGVNGFGGGGGDAGAVTSTVTTTAAHDLVGTTGDSSSAIVAQSVGGGGGSGGVNVTASVNLVGQSGAAIGVGVGGFGGGGGSAGEVTLDVTGNVVTRGNDSHGLLAQSLGGGGGNGGVNVTGALSIAKQGTGGAAAIGVGGFGGDGGNAGDVTLGYEGHLLARPVNAEGGGSHGLFAQSLGGGGGNGGVNVSAGLSFASTSNNGDGHALVVGVGGFGGGGGNAGDVTVNVREGSSISSYGDERAAIFAQSVGGGGGNGGVNVSAGIVSDAPIVFGMGGFGGAGGTAGEVTVDASADISASGDKARGIFAQSIGGGGGNGGLNVSGAISFASETLPPSITVGIGGFGGAGNVSGDVNVTQQGTIHTQGAEGHGIFAQSIAGGGGNGGVNVSTALIFADNNDSGGYKDLSIVSGIGGHGGTGADAGNTTVNSRGEIVTSGDYARGVYAQSIGGGGGNGGFNFAGNLAKKSSIITLGIGGFGSGGGDAGDVTVTRGSADASAGLISTDGIGAIGIESSSIGGGGGNAGVNVVASVLLAGNPAPPPKDPDNPDDPATQRFRPKHTGVDDEVFDNYDKVLDELEGKQTPDKETEQDTQEGQSAFAVQLAIGGSGGGGGDGGESAVNNYGDILTREQQSHGILAQSVGGGGGNATYNVALTYINKDSRNKGLNVSLGGATGDGGDGGVVSVTHGGAIETLADGSHGIIAQSIGGGGGNAGVNIGYSKAEVGKVDISIGRRGGTGGDGGEVSLHSSGSVVTHGYRSWGLLAQSIGGGGGNSSAVTVSLEDPGDDGTPARGASMSVGLEGGLGGTGGSVTITADGWVVTEGRDAHAIFAQSIGGGGGNGGDASGTAANAAISIGGSGGVGGTGGTVDISSAARVFTAGSGAIGIVGQSIGGGGGTGGKSEATIKGSEVGLAISIGGTGGTGAVADTVTVANQGVIVTRGFEAHGVLAQSLGGGGGNASMSIASAESEKGEDEEASPEPQFAIAIGGEGGTGAASGEVRVTNTGSIGTEGVGAVGIFAQSIGGGGGNASQVVSKFSGPGLTINFGVGGLGGEGGTGADVTVENLAAADGTPAEIVTLGDRAHGIVAMSIGGGGGTGSAVVSETEQGSSSILPDEKTAIGLSIKIGGEGGEGGTSGLVTVVNEGAITTYGAGAHGIVAQSIGGGGGSGGAVFSQTQALTGLGTSVERNFAIGGSGGNGNVSGNVEVYNAGSIELFGDGSYGIVAQSVGGGGGMGGLAGAAPPDESGGPLASLLGQGVSMLNFALGGAGGEGADSGDVLVEHTGSIVSHGDNSFGIYAQSVGGGGGSMGASYASPAGAALEFILPLTIGGLDGGSGEAGSVTVNTVGAITMLGANSRAQHAQLVNGGGGDVNLFLDFSQGQIDQGQVASGPEEEPSLFSVIVNALIELGAEGLQNGAGAALKSEHAGTLATIGKNSAASFAQSIGGGGGSGLLQVLGNKDALIQLALALGGSDSVNSGGGDIDLARLGDVLTLGDDSSGTSVQSIGGGGGSLVVDLLEAPAGGTGTAQSRIGATAPDEAPGNGTATATLRMGADGSSGNDGGAVALQLSGDAETHGARSPGMLIQSIGAGGGEVRLSGVDSVEVAFGAINGASGDGGAILLEQAGDIVTHGTLSHGVVLQSIGGGGGAVLTDLDESALVLALNSDNQGSGGAIEYHQAGDVLVTGDGAIGLLAQSLGGGGGLLDRKFIGSAGGAGSSGAVSITLDGSLVAAGAGGIGLFAQSAGADGQGNIEVSLAQGHHIYGGHDGVAVRLSGGAANLLTSHGTVTTAGGVTGWAVQADDGNTRIENHGAMTGQVQLARGLNRFNNHLHASFSPGAVVDLGDFENLLVSEGVLRPGDSLRAESVALNGSLVQTATGITYAELDFGTGQVDQVLASGVVNLAGVVDVSLLNVRFIPVGWYSKVLFEGAEGLADSGYRVETAPSVVISYQPITTPNAAVLAYRVDFAPAGLGRNLRSVGEYLNTVQMAGGGTAAYGEVIASLVADPDMPSYRNSLSQLSPDFYGDHQVRLVQGAADFGQRLTTCRQSGGQYRFTREGSCMWMQYDSHDWSADAGGDFKAIEGSADRFSLGAQKTLENDWSFGFGLSKESFRSDGYDGQWAARGDTHHLGLSAKRRTGPAKLSGVLTYSSSDADIRRSGELLGAFTTSVNRDLSALSGMLRFSHDFEQGEAWYLRPMIDAGMTRLWAERAEEQGAGAISLVFDSYGELHTWIRPAFEVGREFEVGTGNSLRLMLNLGVQKYLDGTQTDVRARLAGAPADVAPMSVGVGLGNPVYSGQLGVEFVSRNDFSARLYLGGSRYDRNDVDAVTFRFQVPIR